MDEEVLVSAVAAVRVAEGRSEVRVAEGRSEVRVVRSDRSPWGERRSNGVVLDEEQPSGKMTSQV